MLKSIGFNKIKIAIFISGNGSNLKNLINHSLKKNSRFKITLIISNNPKAKGLNYARKFKIKKKNINYSNVKCAEKKILIEEGIVEFKNNNLLILTSTAKLFSEINKASLSPLINEAEKKI